MTDTPKLCGHPGRTNVGFMVLPTGEVLCQQHLDQMVHGNLEATEATDAAKTSARAAASRRSRFSPGGWTRQSFGISGFML